MLCVRCADDAIGGFAEWFSHLQYPRTGNATRHPLLEVLMIALCAMLCGAERCVYMEDFGKAKERFLKQFLTLLHGIPSHDTFSRIFRFTDPEQFYQCFQAFVRRFAKAQEGVIAVDGETVRRSFNRATAASSTGPRPSAPISRGCERHGWPGVSWPSARSHSPARPMARQTARADTICSAPRSPPNASTVWRATNGASRGACTGCSTWW